MIKMKQRTIKIILASSDYKSLREIESETGIHHHDVYRIINVHKDYFFKKLKPKNKRVKLYKAKKSLINKVITLNSEGLQNQTQGDKQK